MFRISSLPQKLHSRVTAQTVSNRFYIGNVALHYVHVEGETGFIAFENGLIRTPTVAEMRQAMPGCLIC